jgi:hypothetical protein
MNNRSRQVIGGSSGSHRLLQKIKQTEKAKAWCASQHMGYLRNLSNEEIAQNSKLRVVFSGCNYGL